MSEFKDFLDQIKIRLTNPLIFSFLISWVIIHWQIFVGAFYLTTNDLSELGHINFLDFVKTSINWCNGFWYPLFSAIIYTVLSPLIRIAIQLFNTLINKKGNERIRKVAQEGFIQYEMYDTLLLEVQNQRKRNEEFTTELVKLDQINLDYSNENINLKNQLKKSEGTLNQERSTLNKITDISHINGLWKVEIKDGDKTTKKEILKIKDYSIEELQSAGHFHLSFNISDFFYSPGNGCFFIRKAIDKNTKSDPSSAAFALLGFSTT